ncbi:hybrid sensor histidine kinase/response regulator [soil metagenome]
MDPTQSPELIALFHRELEERSTALVEAAQDLFREELDQARFEEAIREAHTIKGSARLMGDDDIAAAASALERVWQMLRDGRIEAGTEVKASMTELATRLRSAIDFDHDHPGLSAATARLGRAIGMPPQAAEPSGESGTEALGGLLTSVASSLLEGVTRVDTGELYRLINRLVEVSLDTAAIADLTLVNLEGADPRKVLAAWRSQLERLSASVEEVQDQAVALANVSFREAGESFPQFLRYLGRKLGKDVRFELSGEDIELDRQILDQLREPLRHLLVNAVDHGLETPDVRLSKGKPATGTVAVRARLRDDRIQISVSDDGSGVDWNSVRSVARERGLDTDGDLTPLLLRPEFSTRTELDDFSGTGDGLSIVADVVERLHGGIQIESAPLEGTTVLLTLPLSMVLQNMVVVAAGDQFWGLPEASVVASMALGDPRVQMSEGGREMRYEGSVIPVVSLTQMLGLPVAAFEEELVVVGGRAGTVAVTVPEIIDRRRVAVKDLAPILEGTPHITAAAFLGGGEVLVVVDPNYLADYGRSRPVATGPRPSILVVDDSAGVRQLIAASLGAAGFDVMVAAGAKQAVERLSAAAVDALVVDYSMPRSSGVDLVRALRAADVSIPIVMVSGVATASEQAEAWEAGVDAYMDKFDLRKGVLTTTLRRLLEHGLGSTA